MITVQKETTKNPISLIGMEAGICWGADTTNHESNYKRGLDCLVSGHGRTWEYPQVYMILDGYSARVMREFYTHIGGSPTRLQASTRYIDYETGFKYVTPPSIHRRSADEIYKEAMEDIMIAMQRLESIGVPREDCAMLLPLGMETQVVVRTNLRNLIDMSHQRLCSRAYWEYQKLMKDIMTQLTEYSEEWAYLVKHYFKPKCEITGFCTEKKSCKKAENKRNI